jgi:hypothetical protein
MGISLRVPEAAERNAAGIDITLAKTRLRAQNESLGELFILQPNNYIPQAAFRRACVAE